MNSTSPSIIGNTISTVNTLAAQYVEDFANATIEAFARKFGKNAVLYTQDCTVCHLPMSMRAYTALGSIKKYGQFQKRDYCKNCFKKFLGTNSQRPARNAIIAKHAAKTQASGLPAVLDGDILLQYRRRYEGKQVALYFKEVVSFSNENESDRPEYGRVVAVSKNGVSITDSGEPRFYGFADLASIRYVSSPKATKNAATAAV